ncbi:ribosome small subunit-dependent GTPase A [Methanosphaerula subterraneus]|uniref:ribosome small subunit-dependent GTPase A n=1 Tax=Methanosphaerula subterraneus TaxID=3350244 RepID=UPI003F86162A
MNNARFFCGPNDTPPLEALGWNRDLASAFTRYSGRYIPGRVACRQRTHYEVFIEGGTLNAGISGALRRAGHIPVVGDFVALHSRPEAGVSTIVDILPRKTTFTRGVPGKDGVDQVIAANIDTVFIVTAAGRDLNARRLERYLALVHASGAHPVIIINKADLADTPDLLAETISPVTAGVPVITLSALTRAGLSLLEAYLLPGITVALIGSSGVGKSTLINALLEQTVQDTNPVRESDGRGRHKTTVRQLFILQNGALVIDNPGLREVGIGTAGSGISETFVDIGRLAEGCRFSDCRHEQEPGCAVREAVMQGDLTQERLDNYLRLTKEQTFEVEKTEIGLVRYERKRWKAISILARNLSKGKSRF